jgi:hypothetical protein
MTNERGSTEQQAQSRIPRFRTREEEAAWWDSHDITEYLDELRPVKVRFARNLSESITIRFDPETLARLRAEARKKGLGPTTLARMWILERLQSA